ncbi:hypothetical protein [Helicobacter canis]|nr:hypothetical protein [Helicobacter canis]
MSLRAAWCVAIHRIHFYPRIHFSKLDSRLWIATPLCAARNDDERAFS